MNSLVSVSRSSIFLAGFFWGLAGFGLVLVDQFAVSDTTFRLVCFALGSCLAAPHIAGFRNVDGLLILFFMLYVALLFASSVSTTAHLSNGLRELLLMVVAILVCAISNHEQTFIRFLQGILAALFLIVLYLFFQIEFSQIFSPFYRLDAGVGSNAIGFYSIIAFFYASARTIRSRGLSTSRIVFALITIISLAVLVACKSRTALGSLVLVYALLAAQKKPQLTVYMLVLAAVTVLFGSDLVDNVFRISPLAGTSSERNITNFTGRTWDWAEGLAFFAEKPLLGHGMVFSTTDETASVNFHNAFIQMLAISGMLGALPIFAIVLGAIIGFAKALKWKVEASLETGDLMNFTFGVGLLAAFLEDRLLNFGNPASLIFLISIIILFKMNYQPQHRPAKSNKVLRRPRPDQS